MLTEIEHRLTWQPQRELPLLERIVKVGSALLSLKEIEYLGQPQTGTIAERLDAADRPLAGADRDGVVRPRAKRPGRAAGPQPAGEDSARHGRRPRHAAGADPPLAAPGRHLPGPAACRPIRPTTSLRPTVDRVLEIIEKFEEDITDKARLHGQLKVVLDVGEAIEVSPERDRGATVDPLMVQIQQSLQGMIGKLASESKPLDS